MPTETILTVTLITALFIAFGLVLGRASRTAPPTFS